MHFNLMRSPNHCWYFRACISLFFQLEFCAMELPFFSCWFYRNRFLFHTIFEWNRISPDSVTVTIFRYALRNGSTPRLWTGLGGRTFLNDTIIFRLRLGLPLSNDSVFHTVFKWNWQLAPLLLSSSLQRGIAVFSSPNHCWYYRACSSVWCQFGFSSIELSSLVLGSKETDLFLPASYWICCSYHQLFVDLMFS